jgi:hypothetical protein
MAALFIPVEQHKSGSCCAMFVVWVTETPILFSDWQSMRVEGSPAAASNGAATSPGVDRKDEGELGELNPNSTGWKKRYSVSKKILLKMPGI